MSQGPTNFKTMDDVNSGFETGKGLTEEKSWSDPYNGGISSTEDMSNMRAAGFDSLSDSLETKDAFLDAIRGDAARDSESNGTSAPSTPAPTSSPAPSTPAANSSSVARPMGARQSDINEFMKPGAKGTKVRDILEKGFEEIDGSIETKGGSRAFRAAGQLGKPSEKIGGAVAEKIRMGKAESNADRFIKDVDNARSNKWSQHELHKPEVKGFATFAGEELAQMGRNTVRGARKVVGAGKKGIERTAEATRKFNEGLHTPGAELSARQRAAQTAREFPDEEIRPKLSKPEPKVAPKPDVTPDAEPKKATKKPWLSTGAKVGVGLAGAAGVGTGYALGNKRESESEEKGMTMPPLQEKYARGPSKKFKCIGDSLKVKGVDSHVAALAVGAGAGAYGMKRFYDSLEKTDKPVREDRGNNTTLPVVQEGRGKASAKLDRGKGGMKPIKLEKTKLGKGNSKPKDASLKAKGIVSDILAKKKMGAKDNKNED